MPGQLVGPGIELAVAELRLAFDRRHPLRVGLGLGLEQPVHGVLARVVAGAGIELQQYLAALGRRQYRDVLQGQGRGLLQSLGEVFQHALQVATDPIAVHLRHGLHGQAQALGVIVDIQRQGVIAALPGVEHAVPSQLAGPCCAVSAAL